MLGRSYEMLRVVAIRTMLGQHRPTVLLTEGYELLPFQRHSHAGYSSDLPGLLTSAEYHLDRGGSEAVRGVCMPAMEYLCLASQRVIG